MQARYYYKCCRDGKYQRNIQPRQTSDKKERSQESRKINSSCMSRMYVDEFRDGHLELKYIPFHTGHVPGPDEVKHLPLPKRGGQKQPLKIACADNQQPPSTDPAEKTLQVQQF